MSVVLFHAGFVVVLEDDVGWTVGFADQEYATTRYFQFQRAHEMDAQDRALGQDTYYIERDDQSYSCYGGVETVDLHKHTIQLTLNDRGSERLELDKTVLISFDTDEQTLGKVRSGLATVFAGTDTLCRGIDD